MYTFYYYKNKPFLAVPTEFNIKSLTKTIKDKIRFLMYKKKRFHLNEILSEHELLVFQFIKKGIIYFNKDKTVIVDLKKEYVGIVKDMFLNSFYKNYNEHDFEAFKLPQLYKFDEYFGLFEYIEQKEFIDFNYDVIYKLSKEIFKKTGNSHGDFHSTNLIVKNGNIYIIDWDDFGEYTPNYDFLHFFLVDCFRKFEKKINNVHLTYYNNTKKELLNYVSIEEFEKALNIISKKRNFKSLNKAVKL